MRTSISEVRITTNLRADTLCRANSISRNQDLTKDILCGCFFVKYVCCVGFEPPRKSGSVQGLGDWKAPVCQRQKSAANEAKRNKSISRNQDLQNRP